MGLQVPKLVIFGINLTLRENFGVPQKKLNIGVELETFLCAIIIIINDSIYPAVSKASRTGNKVSCQPNDCSNR